VPIGQKESLLWIDNVRESTARPGESTMARQMKAVTENGLHRIGVRGDKGQTSEATLEIKYLRIRVRPPVGKQGKYPPLKLTAIHASERGKPAGRDRIEWKLLY
jgi:hypothetical protein